jgi:hypothetical protein
MLIKNKTHFQHYVFPVTEDELGNAVRNLRGMSSAGFDEIPEYLVKKCIQYIKKPFVHIFQVFFLIRLS